MLSLLSPPSALRRALYSSYALMLERRSSMKPPLMGPAGGGRRGQLVLMTHLSDGTSPLMSCVFAYPVQFLSLQHGNLAPVASSGGSRSMHASLSGAVLQSCMGPQRSCFLAHA